MRLLPTLDTLNVFLALNLMVVLVGAARIAALRVMKRRRARMGGIVARGTSFADLRKRDRAFLLRRWTQFLEVVSRIGQSFRPPDDLRAFVGEFREHAGCEAKLIRQLRRGGLYGRCRAARFLAVLGGERAGRALALCLPKERDERVRVYIAEALLRLWHSAAIPDIVDCLQNASPSTAGRLRGILLGFGSELLSYIPLLVNHRSETVQLLLVRFGARYPTPLLGRFLHGLAFGGGDVGAATPACGIEAFRALCSTYPATVDWKACAGSDDDSIATEAIKALGFSAKADALDLVVSCLEGARREVAIRSLSNLVAASPQLFREAVQLASETDKIDVASGIIEALSSRVEYFLPRLKDSGAGMAMSAVAMLLADGKVSDLVHFLNENADREIEDSLVDIISAHRALDKRNDGEYSVYLDERILSRLGLSRVEKPNARRGKTRESIPRLPLVALLMCLVAFYPCAWLLYDARSRDELAAASESLARFIDTARKSPASSAVAARRAISQLGASWPGFRSGLSEFLDFSLSLFSWYCLAVNTFSFLFIGISFFEARRRSLFSALKDETFLFREGMLPSISIVAPAYNEEATIITSVEALLNLHYPDFEVIVVNDGSGDSTLATVVSHFRLRKRDLYVEERLRTQSIRGIYVNPRYPNLIVVDKVNGGKADSLNAGINVASRDYFAGIDSDSLLERDSLLLLAGSFIDAKHRVIASGGMIVPVNGCTVRAGEIVNPGLPRRPLAVFQAMEYLRAFMAARVGQAAMKSLLIISGAFGVFERELVIGARGYLTSSEAYGKDTVGEDMELVVRLTRIMCERGEPYSVEYSPRARCWTEVPESGRILKRQRDRWQRGLIDILFYHKRMLANPRYGMAGVFAFPYYFVFEVSGPWIEAFALAFLALQAAIGGLTIGLVLTLVCVNLLFGVLVSASSILIAEWYDPLFGKGSRWRLMFASVLENFGYRQWMSIYRLKGYGSALARKTGWGAMTRKGFATGGRK